MKKNYLYQKMHTGIIVLIFFSGLCYGQLDRYYTPCHGLSNTSFYSIVQDNDGFIWISTNGGLNKFDGHSFTVYQHNPVDTNSIDLNAVTSIFVDSKGTLWVGTEHGLQTYNKQKDNFNHFPILFNNTEQELQITQILEDKWRNIWLTSSLGLIKIDRETKLPTFFNKDRVDNNTIARYLLNAALIDGDEIWIASEKDGLYCYDLITEKFVNYRHDEKNNSVCDNSILSLGKDKNSNIIIGAVKGGMSIFERTTGKFKTIPYNYTPGNIFNGGVYSIVTENNGTVWIGTERNGLKILDTENYTLHDANNKIDLDDICDSKIHLYSDRQDNLWLAIDYAGIYMKQRKAKPFYNYQKISESSYKLSNNIVKAILYDSNNNLWVGTDGGGLNYLSKGSNKFKVFMNELNNPNSIPDNAVISICEDQNNNIWVGTYLGGLSFFDKKNNRFTKFLIDPVNKGRDFNYVMDILPDNNGNLWVATNGGGLQKFNIKNQSFKSYSTFYIDEHPIELPLFLTKLLLDSDDNLWIGSYNGLTCLNQEKGIYKTYTTENRTLENEGIYSILEDSNGKIWFGTGSGLYVINKNSWELKRYTTSNCLSSNYVYGILEDRKGNLWISTLNGLSKFNTRTKIFRNYFTYDGLPGNEYRPSSCYKAKDGTLYFGSTSGLVYFHPDSIKEISTYPRLTFTQFKIFNDVVTIGEKHDGLIVLNTSIDGANIIRLPYSENSFTIEFAAIDYNAPEKIRYAYMMDGFDKKLVYKDFNQRFATYTNINPGTYIFRLKSTNIDGVWNDKYKSVSIVIEPPWWRTIGAYITYIVISILLFILIRKMILFRVEMKNKLRIEHLEREKLEELNQSKAQFFSNVSHEFRTPLTLILGPVEKILNSKPSLQLKKQVEFIHRNAIRLLRLVNLLLDLQKVEKNQMKLRVRFSDVVNFAKEIIHSFEDLAEQKKISLEFESKMDKLDLWFDPDKLDKVLFNLLSNAIKFTSKGGKVSVRLKTGENDAYGPPLNEHLIITVTDNGKGIKEEKLIQIFERFYQVESEGSITQLGSGIGLHLSKFLVELHYGTITVTSKEGLGTRFDILIPLKGDHLSDEEKVIGQIDLSQITHTDYFDVEEIGMELDNNINTKTKEEKELEKPYKVLIIEDDIDIRSYIKLELNDQYEIYEASDGLEGWTTAKKVMPDLIISDIMMPKMDGIQLCKKIKTDIHTSHIPVILLTARTSIENRIEGLDTGADSYIPKPFHPQHLRVRVEKLIELRQNLMKKFSKTIGFTAKEMTLTSADEKFLQKAIDLVIKNISNTELNIEEMSSELGISRVHMYRKIKALTDQTPSEFVRIIRLKQAAHLLEQDKLNISEVAYAVGFNSHQYFTNSFQNYFNKSPSEYSARIKNKSNL